jgi:two-component sensor histidine kinase
LRSIIDKFEVVNGSSERDNATVLKNARHGNWEQRAATQRTLIRVAVISVAVITIAALIGLLLPVRSMIRARDRRQFETEATLIRSQVRGYFEQSIQIAAQTPSRSRIREELVAYLRGERSLDSYRAFATPKLVDAVEASREMVSIFRFDRSQRMVSAAYPELVDLPELRFDPEEPTLIPVGCCYGASSVFLVVVPIVHPGFGLAGFDAVALTMAPIESRMADAVMDRRGARVLLISNIKGEPSVDVAAGATASEVAEFRDRDLRSSRDSIVLDGTSFAADVSNLYDEWTLAVLMDESVLYGSSERGVRLIAVVVIVVGALLGAVSWWMLELVRERSQAEASELAEIVTSQTTQLRELLDQRELLIREVHHRIKNDMGLVSSFLRLHLQESDSEEAKQTLREADAKLSIMSEIYDRLYRSQDVGAVEIKPVLERLLTDIGSTAGFTSANIVTHVEDVSIERSIATSLSIVANELVTNSLKYANVDPLTIEVELTRLPDGALRFSVVDNGPGFPESVIAGKFGFGLTMVKALVEQVDGELHLANDGPSRVTVVLPPGTY